jgi:predicted DNA-binding transcriptional regulator AlpA
MSQRNSYADLVLLTPLATLTMLKYTTSQLHLLTRLHGFPMPVDYGDGRCGWEPDAVEAWRARRDHALHSRLI